MAWDELGKLFRRLHYSQWSEESYNLEIDMPQQFDEIFSIADWNHKKYFMKFDTAQVSSPFARFFFFSAGMTFRNGLRWTLKTFSSTTLHKREQRILSFRNWYASTISRDIFDHSLKAYKISWKSNQVLRYIWPYCAFINWSAYHYSFDIGKDCNTTDCGHSVALQK